MTKGDYVLATKYEDGSPRDQFAIGFFKCMFHGRYMVVDSDGKPFRRSGFRRAEKITTEMGELLLENMDLIQQGDSSIWYWRYNPKRLRRGMEAIL